LVHTPLSFSVTPSNYARGGERTTIWQINFMRGIGCAHLTWILSKTKNDPSGSFDRRENSCPHFDALQTLHLIGGYLEKSTLWDTADLVSIGMKASPPGRMPDVALSSFPSSSERSLGSGGLVLGHILVNMQIQQ
jgi:hypothetical protein